jgi:undecaprenyl-diphosphatase
MDYFNAVEQWLIAHPTWVFIAIGLSAFIESLAIIGIVVPGVAILFAVAAVAGGIGLAIEFCLLAACLGAISGDVLSYYLGHHLGPHLKQRWPISHYPKAIQNGEIYFNKYGSISVMIGRFIGPLRPVLPMIAGMLKMPAPQFVSFNVLSSLIWAPVYILPGYLSGAARHILWPENSLMIFAALSITLTLVILVTHFTLKKFYQTGHQDNSISVQYLRTKAFFVLSLASFFFITLIQYTDVVRWFNENLLFSILTLREELPTLYSHILNQITMLGDQTYLIVMFSCATVYLLVLNYKPQAMFLACNGLLVWLCSLGLKETFAVARPEWFAGRASSLAFPSGHTSGSLVLFASLGLILCFNQRLSLARPIWFACMAIAVLVGFSRLALGVHWFADILGGFTLGASIIYFSLIRRDVINWKMLGNVDSKRLVLGLLLLTLVYQFAFKADSFALYSL